VYQTLEPVPAAVPTQSFLARSKYDGAPGAPGATAAALAVVAAAAELAAVAAGTATAKPVRTAALAANVKVRRPRAMARPLHRRPGLPRCSGPMLSFIPASTNVK
jgi:hypothetical protein